MTTSQRLSVVATSRNDDHGGYLLPRMQRFLDELAAGAARHELDVELVMVEWNPPGDRPPLEEALSWPRHEGFVTRIVTVPSEVHDRIDHSSELPLFQMLAKNVGIRRSRGDFVLATNIDVLFADELLRFLRAPLAVDTVYRTDRIDIPFEPEKPPVVVSGENLVPKRIMRKDGVHYPGEGRTIPIYQGLLDLFRFVIRRPGGATIFRERFRVAREQGRLASELQRVAGAAWEFLIERPPSIHTNGCGDFTLMARDAWGHLRGYPEWHVWSWHLDSVLLYQAAAAGLRFVDLPPELPVFHMEHAAASGWTPEAETEMFARIDQKGIPYLKNEDVRRLRRGLRADARAGRPTIFNAEDWGMRDEELPEVEIAEDAAAR